MSRSVILIAAFAFLVAPVSVVQARVPLAKSSSGLGVGIAATVNDELITTKDVDNRVNMAIHGANFRPSPDEMQALRKQALDALIDEQVRLQEAKRQNALPTDEEINESFSRMAAQNRMSPEQFKVVLQKTSGVYESLQRQIKTQLAWSNVVRQKIRPQVNITEADINAYLEQKEKNPAKVEYNVAEIFMKNNDENRKIAEHMIADLRNGKQRFSVVARQFSQGLEASKGGLLGWIEEKRLEPVLDDAIAQTPAGKITDIITSQRGLHIFLVRDKRDILQTSEASQRLHIKQIALALPPTIEDEVRKQALKHMEFLRSESKDCKSMDGVIEKVDSPLAQDLGKIRLADLPPAAIPKIKDLALEKISDTVTTPDGYVIYMVCEREENSEDTVRDDVAETLGTDRLNRLQSRYYRDLRASSYIDIKKGF